MLGTQAAEFGQNEGEKRVTFKLLSEKTGVAFPAGAAESVYCSSMREVVIVVMPVEGSVVVEKSGTGSALFQMTVLLASRKSPGEGARSIRRRSGVKTVNRAVP